MFSVLQERVGESLFWVLGEVLWELEEIVAKYGVMDVGEED